MAFAHAARFHRAARPAEAFGALRIAGAQLLAGIGLVLVAVALGEVDQAQLQRIDAARMGQLVHGAFQCVYAEGRAGRAHVDRGEHVERREAVVQRDVVAAIEHSRPLHLVLGEVLEARGLADGAVPHRLQSPGLAGRQRQTLNAARAVAEGEHLLTGQHHAHRALELECGHHRQRQLVLRPQAGAEGAADERR